jgi:hypothetical protein
MHFTQLLIALQLEMLYTWDMIGLYAIDQGCEPTRWEWFLALS